ncbi:MAG: hypothetical protein ACE5MG_06800 [Candidatus Methylomirabilales bacterium]
MKKNVGRVRRNESEEIRLSLQEADGELHVELRVYSRSKGQGGAYLPEPEAIVVPARALSDLSRALEAAHDSLRNEGVVESPSISNLITIDGGSASVDLADTFNPPANEFTPLPDTQSEHRVAVNFPLECYLLRAPETSVSEELPGQVTGDIRIVSGRGALVWLPERFPPRSHLAVLIRDGELNFRGQAEVVEVASQPKDGKYWHRLEWMSLTEQANASLSKIIEAATQSTSGTS